MENTFGGKTIPVTIDKSHLVTIGEKLYTEKMSFIRELVNNAYDADATEVRVDISPTAIVISDNGSGMDEGGLRQYFTIGSGFKKDKDTSPVYGRKRIGEFGIGKFSALAICKKFEIDTQKGDFRARLIFDKEAWSMHEDWHLNIDILPPDPERKASTIITLRDINTQFQPTRVKRYLAERTPIHAPDFMVAFNGDIISEAEVAGKRLAIHVHLMPYGIVSGELVVAGGVIYINLDHPLYRTWQKEDAQLTQNIARIITKELALQTGVQNVQEAFQIQTSLLSDALKEK
jgi:hypothetical protein